MPVDLWDRVAAALDDVLDGPDGDVRLWNLLRRTMKAEREDRPERSSA
jgi:hypothetical protein